MQAIGLELRRQLRLLILRRAAKLCQFSTRLREREGTRGCSYNYLYCNVLSNLIGNRIFHLYLTEDIGYLGSCLTLLFIYHVRLVSPTGVSACEPDNDSGHCTVPDAIYDSVSDDTEVKSLESEVGSRIRDS